MVSASAHVAREPLDGRFLSSRPPVLLQRRLPSFPGRDDRDKGGPSRRASACASDCSGTNPGPVADVQAIRISTDLHVAAVTANGELWHTVRLSNGSWLPFGSVKAATHNDPGDVTDVAVAAIAGELHLFVTTTNLGMWHNSPREGTWEPFRSFNQPTRSPFTFKDVAAVSIESNLLSLDSQCLQDQPGGGGERVVDGIRRREHPRPGSPPISGCSSHWRGRESTAFHSLLDSTWSLT